MKFASLKDKFAAISASPLAVALTVFTLVAAVAVAVWLSLAQLLWLCDSLGFQI